MGFHASFRLPRLQSGAQRSNEQIATGNQAAIAALGFNVLMVVMAIISIMLTVPKGTKAQA